MDPFSHGLSVFLEKGCCRLKIELIHAKFKKKIEKVSFLLNSKEVPETEE